jgi:phosphate transport system substrate-binding protein
MKKRLAALVIFTLCSACGGGSSAPVSTNAGTAAPSAGKTQLNGAGATFPYPLYSKWFAEYNKLHPNVQINYQSIGSGGGIRQLIAQTVFFGATDAPMTDEQMSQAPGKVLHFPTVLGAVVPIFNVDGAPSQLKFTGPILADIFLGNIKKWNDPALAKANAGAKLPNSDITVVHRSDGSGTSFIFTDYLGKVSPEWKQKVGVNAAVNWPVGVGGKGNEGVTGLVKQTPNSVGYVELVYALQNKIPYGAVQNQGGAFVLPSTDSVTAAAAAMAANMPKDFRVSITNAPGQDAYPIASFTWILMYEDPKDKALANVMVDFMKWALTDGQRLAPTMGYASVPTPVAAAETDLLNQIKVQ